VKTRKKVALKKVNKLDKKSHKIKCKECGTPVICDAKAIEVECSSCVAKKGVLSVRKTSRKSLKKTKKKIKK